MIETKIFVGTQIADAMIADIRQRLSGEKANCYVVRDVGNGPSQAYTKRLSELGAKAGVTIIEAGYETLADLLAAPTQAPVMFLHPAPTGIDISALIETLGPLRDAEGVHPLNAGKLALGVQSVSPPTAQAAMLVAQELAGSLGGKLVALVGASNVVGVPLGLMLLQEGATVRIAQKSTGDLKAETRDADIVISAAGVPGLIGADHIRQGAYVIDVGVTRVAGRLVGDVDQSALMGKAAAVTHVPDGVGPITAACLFKNILKLRQLA